LRLKCAILAEIVRENGGAHIAMTGRNVQDIGKTRNKTNNRKSRNVRPFILPCLALPCLALPCLAPSVSRHFRSRGKSAIHATPK
jgi:hypothetical protein